MTTYSAEHCAAYKRWQASGSAAISDADVALIEREDGATGRFIRLERAETLRKDLARMRQNFVKALPPAAPAAAQSLADYGKAPVLFEHLSAALDGAIAGIAQRLKELSTRIAALEQGGSATGDASLEQRVKALESRPTVEYHGVWDASVTYGKGALVTHSGSMWHATEASIGRRPGTDAAFWKLAVKRGQDGRAGQDLR